jgi:hypothetical protein
VRISKDAMLTETDFHQLRGIAGVKRVDDEAGISQRLFSKKSGSAPRLAIAGSVKQGNVSLKCVAPVPSWDNVVNQLSTHKVDGQPIALPSPIRTSLFEAVFLVPPNVFAALAEPLVLGGVIVMSRLRDVSL